MSEPVNEKGKKATLVFYVSPSQNEIWEQLKKLPGFGNQQDLFRDMLRFYAKHKGVLKNATE